MIKSLLGRDVQEGCTEKVTFKLSLKDEQVFASWKRGGTKIWVEGAAKELQLYSLDHWFSTGGDFAPTGKSAMSRDTFGCYY